MQRNVQQRFLRQVSTAACGMRRVQLNYLLSVALSVSSVFQCVALCASSVWQCVAVCASSVWPDIFCNIMRRALLLLTSECWPMSRRWNSGHRVCQYGGEEHSR